MIKFKSFTSYCNSTGTSSSNAACELTTWLQENPDVELLDWKVCSTGSQNWLTIVIQYKERD
ncbi:MAG: hypothetical protein J6A25_07590 [Lachnospiraceae bacterium]|nr:hypothetical protein [Lachnospiraceae bacterium]